MTIDAGTVCLILFAQVLGYTVKGLIGFGNPLISAPLLSMRLDNVVITPGSLIMDIPINAYLTWKNRRCFDWRQVMPMLLAVIAGAVPGILLLRLSLPWILKTLLGLVVVFLGAEMALRRHRPARPREPNPWVRALVAFLSGVCAGVFGINMFLVAYLERTAKDYSAFKGSLCFLFLGENLFRFAVYAASGMMAKEVLLFGALSLPAGAVGMLLSGLLGPRLDEEKLKAAAVGLFILGGVSIIVKSVVFHT